MIRTHLRNWRALARWLTLALLMGASFGLGPSPWPGAARAQVSPGPTAIPTSPGPGGPAAPAPASSPSAGPPGTASPAAAGAAPGAVPTTATAAPPGEISPQDFPIQYIIFLVQENRSFDHYFGVYPFSDGEVPIYVEPGTPIPNGIQSLARPRAETEGSSNDNDSTDRLIVPHRVKSPLIRDIKHQFEVMKRGALAESFEEKAQVQGRRSLGYYDFRTIPHYWTYAREYVLMDNYFAPMWGSSGPNHIFMVAAQSGGVTINLGPPVGPWSWDPKGPELEFPTIVDRLQVAGVSWSWYFEGLNSGEGYIAHQNPFGYFPHVMNDPDRVANLKDFELFDQDLASGNLPHVVWIKANRPDSEHPDTDVTEGQNWAVSQVNKIMASPYWTHCAIFLFFDESGGWYDHVSPPQVDEYGLGPRAPMLVISPYAKRNYVSSVLAEHSSLLKLLEWRYGLPPLTARDAGANNVLDAFDFAQPPRPPYIMPVPAPEKTYPVPPVADGVPDALPTIGPSGGPPAPTVAPSQP